MHALLIIALLVLLLLIAILSVKLQERTDPARHKYLRELGEQIMAQYFQAFSHGTTEAIAQAMEKPEPDVKAALQLLGTRIRVTINTYGAHQWHR